MEHFSAEFGNIHFLFGDEDEYYTESLLKLNLQQYLNYCLQKDGYTRIFFVHPDFVETGNEGSAKEYYEARTELFSWLLGMSSVSWDKEDVLASGRKIGERSVIRHLTKEGPAKRIHYLLKNRQSGNKYAFVIPLSLFSEIYGNWEMRRELSELLRPGYGNPVMILTSGMKADESFSILTRNPELFSLDLFPEMSEILKSDETLRFYEEMRNELGDRYHVLNQLREKDIRRLIQYIQWVEGKENAGNVTRVDDYTAVLYAWYHSPDFGAEENIGLPPKSSRSLAELGRVLRQENGRIWRNLDAVIERLWEEQLPNQKLKDLLIRKGLKEGVRHPLFAESSEVRRLRNGISGITYLHDESLSIKIWQVEEMLRCPFIHPERTADTGLNKMLKILEEMQVKQIQSRTTAVYVLDYLNYTVRSRETREAQNLFKMKCDCYEQRIRCSCTLAELKKIKEERINRRKRYQLEFERTKERLEKLRKQDPLYDELIRRMMEGSVEPSFVALHAPEVNQEKEELLRLNRAIENETAFINKNQEDISFYTTSINNLELTITELCYEKNPGILKDVLERANQMLKAQGEREERSSGEMWKTADSMQKTFEKLQKTEKPRPDSDRLFAELMNYSEKQKDELTYEI